jgi:hypothetical protein
MIEPVTSGGCINIIPEHLKFLDMLPDGHPGDPEFAAQGLSRNNTAFIF